MRSFVDHLKRRQFKLEDFSHEDLAALIDGVRDAHRSYLFSCDVRILHKAFLRVTAIEKTLAVLKEGQLTRMDKVRSRVIRDMQREAPLLKTSLERKYVTLGGK